MTRSRRETDEYQANQARIALHAMLSRSPDFRLQLDNCGRYWEASFEDEDYIAVGRGLSYEAAILDCARQLNEQADSEQENQNAHHGE